MLKPYEFEVAIEILGQSKQPLVNEIDIEEDRENPDEKYLKFLYAREALVENLLDELEPSDEYLVKRILDKNDILRKLL